LPVATSGDPVPLWQDVPAAGLAVFAYSVFFSMPPRMFPCPVAMGMLVHAARWVTLSCLGLGVATGALVACALVGFTLTPVSRPWHMPFAAIGFASVVSMIPGVYLFRMASGLVQLSTDAPAAPPSLAAIASDGITALIIILAMSFGLIAPEMIVDRLYRLRAARSLET
jgi:uncharacterized membrane protein YjjB (DUF3815 family)